MMLPYYLYSDSYANKCKKCDASKRVKVHGIWTTCECQHAATVKFRFDRFEISGDLKRKNWEDFTGFDRGKQSISEDSLVSAKQKALRYCFGDSGSHPYNDRRKNLIVHKHLQDGQNVIIVGGSQSGRTLLATLIIKEVSHAHYLFGGGTNKDVTYKYIKAHNLLDAARWFGGANRRDQQHDLLDELATTSFLVIDQVDLPPPKGHHTNPPDWISLAKVFSARIEDRLPTIVICSAPFWARASDSRYEDDVVSQWGRYFVLIMNDPKNVVIELRKGK